MRALLVIHDAKAHFRTVRRTIPRPLQPPTNSTAKDLKRTYHVTNSMETALHQANNALKCQLEISRSVENAINILATSAGKGVDGHKVFRDTAQLFSGIVNTLCCRVRVVIFYFIFSKMPIMQCLPLWLPCMCERIRDIYFWVKLSCNKC